MLDPHQALKDAPVLAHALAAQDHMALEDFPRARIDYRTAIGPAAGLAMHPLDDIVARIERVHALGQELDAIGVFKAGRFKGLRPPVPALDQGLLDQLGRAAIHVIDDGLDHRTGCSGRIDPFQPVALGEAALERGVERGRHVISGHLEGAAARVRRTGFIPVLGQGDEGVMHRQRHRLGIGCGGAHLRAGIVGGEGEKRINLHVFGKCQDAFGQRRATLGIDREGALTGIVEITRRINGIALEKA